MSRGLNWDDLEAVLGDPPEYRAEDRYALRPWDGPPGQCWRFWNMVWQLRRNDNMRHWLCFFGWHDWRLNKISRITKRNVYLWYVCTRCEQYEDDWIEFHKP